ncbi:MAG: DUF4145 domain-containing protein [Acidimicrobiia bacterium]
MSWNDAFRFRDCPWCGLRDAELKVAAGPFATDAPDRGSRTWTALRCPRCAGVSLIETRTQSSPPTIIQVVPSERRVPVKHLPDQVSAYYSDALRALDAGIPDAAAVQLRRTLEAAAGVFDSGSDDGRPRPLVKLVERLIDEGLVTRPFGDVLHHIRQVGNVGAHATDERLDAATVERALAFTTQVLRNLFEIPFELEAIDEAEDPEPD